MDKSTLLHVAALAKLQFTDDEIATLSASTDGIEAFIRPLQDIDTNNVAPLVHPLEFTQPLRDDAATSKDWRDAAFSLAPVSEQAHFLVPQVIE